MKTEVYLVDITACSDEYTENEFAKISTHFISTDGEKLSMRKESKIGKILLCRILEKNGAGEFQVHYKDSEKPVLVSDKDIYFNISHSGRFVAVAVSEEEVGCDIQEIKPYNPKVAKRNYCEKETALIENSEDKDSVFIKLWALKESILKYTGKGISGGLATYDFSSFANEEKFSTYGYEFYTFKMEDTFFALCYGGGDVEIKNYTVI